MAPSGLLVGQGHPPYDIPYDTDLVMDIGEPMASPHAPAGSGAKDTHRPWVLGATTLLLVTVCIHTDTRVFLCCFQRPSHPYLFPSGYEQL